MNGGERTRCKNNVRFSICSRVEVQGKLLWDIDTLSSDELVKKKKKFDNQIAGIIRRDWTLRRVKSPEKFRNRRETFAFLPWTSCLPRTPSCRWMNERTFNYARCSDDASLDVFRDDLKESEPPRLAEKNEERGRRRSVV